MKYIESTDEVKVGFLDRRALGLTLFRRKHLLGVVFERFQERSVTAEAEAVVAEADLDLTVASESDVPFVIHGLEDISLGRAGIAYSAEILNRHRRQKERLARIGAAITTITTEPSSQPTAPPEGF